jgi:hypothetical protein
MMPGRVFVAVRVLRLVLILALAGMIAQLPRSNPRQPWIEFVSPLLIRGTSAEEYHTLESLANESDLVVVGRITMVERGRELVAIPELVDNPDARYVAFVRFANATLEIERVLATGLSSPPTTVELEMLVLGWSEVTTLQRSLPAERGLFFLRHKRSEAGGRYYRLVNVEQGLIGSDSGIAVIPGAATLERHDFLRSLEGRPFEEVVAEIDRLIQR